MRYVGIIATRAALDPIGFHFRLRGFLPFIFENGRLHKDQEPEGRHPGVGG